MTNCTDCARDLNRFNPACANCGRRYIAAVQRKRMPLEAKQAWLRKVLADWMEFGHSEADIRAPAEKE